ncbi:MAG: hypothetical protein ACE5IR_17295 [bacterium]
MKKFCRFALLFILLLFMPLNEASAQTGWAGKSVISPAFQYQYLPDNWKINYYGLTTEFYFSERISVSGPVLIGWDRRDNFYLHMPFAGFVVLGVAAWLNTYNEDPWLTSDLLKLLIVENIHYNIRTAGKVILSPFLSFLGADLTGNEEDGDGNGLLSFGGGLQIKALVSEHFMLSSYASLKYYIIGDKTLFGSGNQFGITIGFNLGYVF